MSAPARSASSPAPFAAFAARALALAALFALLVAPARAVEVDSAAAAEVAIADVSSFKELRRFLKQYGQHDQGAVGAKVSDFVCGRLAGDWGDLEALERETRWFEWLEERVLEHLDANCRAADLSAIVDHATHRCPTRSARLCIALAKHAQQELDRSGRAAR